MRKKLLTLAMVVTMATAITACGGSEDDNGNATQTTKQNNENDGTADSSDDTSKDDSNEETTGDKAEVEEYVDTIEDDKYEIAQFIKDTYPDANVKLKKEMVIEKQDIEGEMANLFDTDLSYTVTSEWELCVTAEKSDLVTYRYQPEERDLLSDRIYVTITAENDRQECTEDEYVRYIKQYIDSYAKYDALYEKVIVYRVNINGYEGYGIETYKSQCTGRSYMFWLYIDGHVYSVELKGIASKSVGASDELHNEVEESAMSVISTITCE